MILNDLRKSFKYIGSYSGISDSCSSLTDSNRTLLGDSNPATGRPAVSSPNSSFSNWYIGCLVEYINAELNSLEINTPTPIADSNDTEQAGYSSEPLSETDNRKYFGTLMVDELITQNPNAVNDGTISVYEWQSALWRNFSEKAKKDLLRNQLSRLVGPDDVLIDLGLESESDQLAQVLVTDIYRYVKSNESLFEFLEVSNTGDDLSIIDITKIAIFLIKTKDTLRY